MSKISKYTVLKDINLVVQYHQNELELEGLKKSSLQIAEDNSVKSMSQYDTIVDIRNCNINCTIQELQCYRKFISQCYPERDVIHRVAILSDEPRQVAKATIFTITPAKDLVQYKIFSSIEGALRWLNRPTIQEVNIEKVIDSYKDKSSLRNLIHKKLKYSLNPLHPNCN